MNITGFPNCCGAQILTGFYDNVTVVKKNLKQMLDNISFSGAHELKEDLKDLKWDYKDGYISKKVYENKKASLKEKIKKAKNKKEIDTGLVVIILNPEQRNVHEKTLLKAGFELFKAGFNPVHEHNVYLYVLNKTPEPYKKPSKKAAEKGKE